MSLEVISISILYPNSDTPRANMERGVEAWVEELLGGVLPPGNADPAQRLEWEGGAAAASVEEEAAAGGGRGVVGVGPATLDTQHMSAAELAVYEEKRLKMRKVGKGEGWGRCCVAGRGVGG